MARYGTMVTTETFKFNGWNVEPAQGLQLKVGQPAQILLVVGEGEDSSNSPSVHNGDCVGA